MTADVSSVMGHERGETIFSLLLLPTINGHHEHVFRDHDLYLSKD